MSVHRSVLNMVAPSIEAEMWPAVTLLPCAGSSAVERGLMETHSSVTAFYKSSLNCYSEVLFSISKLWVSVSTCLLSTLS